MTRHGPDMDLSSYNAQEDNFIEAFGALQNTYDAWKICAKETVTQLSTRSRMYGKALPGRAIMLISTLDINEAMMPAVFEQPNSPKIGKYVPGTKIEVQSDNDILATDPEILIVWSWHIVEEIVKYLDSLGYRGEIWVPLPEFRLYRPAL
jgi:hypothetical protein